MEDSEIVDLYWQREEIAIQETEYKYGAYLTKIAYNVLFDIEDSKEVVNDTYLKAWNSMPVHKPKFLLAYLGKITRQLSIDIFRKKHSKKRICSEYLISLSELEECVTETETPEQKIEFQVLSDTISAYLRSLPKEACNAFICRYFFMDSIREIALYLGTSEARIKSMLYRCRKGLKEYLEQEGFIV